MALVSIIVPVYNVENYLEKCISSLLNQTLQDIEIICVNDGSTDNSLQILKEFAICDSRIKIISKDNSGYGDSMNVGIANAQGEYIGIVESDDFALGDMFANLYLIIKEKEADVIKSNYYSFSEKLGRKYEEILSKIPYYDVFCPCNNEDIWSVTPSIWSALYRREFLEKQKILFHTSEGASYQDVSFWFKVLLSAEKMICVPEAYLCYRCDNENSSVKSSKKVFCIMEEFDVIKKYVRERCFDSMFPIVLREQFIHYIGNYLRVDSLYQYAFLEKMKEELKKEKEQGHIVQKFWSEDNWRLLQLIIQDSNAYFESTNIDYLNKYIFKEYTVNYKLSELGAEKLIENAEKIIIYGAGIYGTRLLDRFSDKSRILGFAVTKLDDNAPKYIQGVSVYEIKELREYNAKAVVIVAMKKVAQLPVLKILKKYGFNLVISIDRI